MQRFLSLLDLTLCVIKKYINNAGYVASYSPNRSLCEGKSSSTLLEMQGVSSISSHGTVHFDVAHCLDDLHTGYGSSESVSTLVSIHENSHPTFLIVIILVILLMSLLMIHFPISNILCWENLQFFRYLIVLSVMMVTTYLEILLLPW